MHIEYKCNLKDVWIKGVYLLPAPQGLLHEDCLYFTDDIDAAGYVSNAKIVILTNHNEANIYTCSLNCILLHTSESLSSVFNRVLGYHHLLHDWLYELEIISNTSNNTQKLLDLSERVFCNPITICPPAMKVLYATWNIEPTEEDFFFYDLYNNKYPSVHTFNTLRENGYLSQSYFSNDIIHIPPLPHKNFDTIQCQ